MKRAIFFIVVLFLCPNLSLSQDPEFTQFYANPIYLNPALAGSHGCPRLNMNYRNQWPSLSGAFVTSTVSYDQFVDPISGGIAVMLVNDMAGKNTINTNSINLAYSYHMKVTHDFSILIGAQASWTQKFLNWNKLTFGDQIDPHSGFVYASKDLPRGLLLENGWGTKGFFDVSAGIVAYSKHFYVGFAAKHLNAPNESLIADQSILPARFTGHIGANIPFGGQSKYQNSTSISPNIIYTYQRGYQQTNMGLYIKHNVVTAGVWWRPYDSFILSIGVENGAMTFGYSYDLTTSKLTNASGGSHELSLAYRFACKERLKHYRTLSCPSY